MIIEAYAKEKPDLLGLEEHRRAKEMWELTRKMYGYDIDLPQKEED